MQQEIKKCPACGAIRNAFSAQCPECGYEFQDTSCKVIDELNNKLDSIAKQKNNTYTRKQLQLDIIKNFAIPQIKEELLDLLVYIQPKTAEKNSDVTDAWRMRQREVVNRAKLAFAEDRMNLAKVLEYEKDLDRLEKQKIRRWWQKLPFIGKVAIILGVIFVLLLIIPAKDISPEAYAERFSNAVMENNYDDAMEYLKKSPEMGELISDQYLTLINGLINENRVVEAEILYNDINKYVNKNKYSSHISKTHLALIDHHLANDNIDKAILYAKEKTGMVKVLKHLILNDNTEMAIKFFKRNSQKLTDYDTKKRKRVLTFEDEVIEEFANKNKLLR